MNLSQLRCCQCEEPLKEEEIALAQTLSDERDLVTCERCEMLCDVQDLAHEASADAAHGALLAALTMEEADHEDSSVHRAALEAAQRAAREVLRTARLPVDEHLESQAFELAEGVALAIAAETLDGKDCRLRGHGRSHLLSFVLNGRYEDTASQRFQVFSRQVHEEKLRARLRRQTRSILEMAKTPTAEPERSADYNSQPGADSSIAAGGRS